jgi:hypothetical protein
MSEVAGMRPDLLLLGVCSIHANEGLGAFDAGDAEMLIQRLSRKFRPYILLVWRATIQLKALYAHPEFAYSVVNLVRVDTSVAKNQAGTRR